MKRISLPAGWRGRLVCTALWLAFLQPSLHGQFEFENYTVTWEECIRGYRELDERYGEGFLTEAGSTDVGKPLHLFVMDGDRQFDPATRRRDKPVILILNAIHPGEPDGVDASLRLAEILLDASRPEHHWLDSLTVCIVPMYNVDGALRRNSSSRVNQQGPSEYGFRGNARNLDLNRDFIKCDSENARSFSRMFTQWQPHLLVDTHVSDGADYPYTMTLISTQRDKLGEPLATFLREVLEPDLYRRMEAQGWPMAPYVHTMGFTPESGLVDFLETPRFSTGYAALFQTIGLVTETHMLKPFPQRAESTLRFLLSLVESVAGSRQEVLRIRAEAETEWQSRPFLDLEYALDTSRCDTFLFRGYTPRRMPALVGSGNRLHYDSTESWQRPIPHYRCYRPEKRVKVPEAYIVPRAWREVVERLQCNGVEMLPLDADREIDVEITYIDSFKTAHEPYEGHYLHRNIHIHRTIGRIQFHAGDWVIPTQQRARRYLVEVLEPESGDSFFAWNFFDSALQQKEWFSDYVFEPLAWQWLKENPDVQASFQEALARDPGLAANHWEQLYWIYRRSPWYEESAYRYPVFRIP